MTEHCTDYKHGVSLTLVVLMNRFERNEVSKEQYLAVVNTLQAVSVDDQQHRFFDAIKKLLDKVERFKLGLDGGE
jgi:hypothetical protein